MITIKQKVKINEKIECIGFFASIIIKKIQQIKKNKKKNKKLILKKKLSKKFLKNKLKCNIKILN
jgi:hypothetical protein